MSHPFSRRRPLFVFVLLWLLVASIQYLVLNQYFRLPVIQALEDALVFNFLYAGLAYSLWFVINSSKTEEDTKLDSMAKNVVAMIMLVIVAILAGTYTLRSLVVDDQVYQEFLSDTLVWRTLITFFLFTSISLIYLVYKYAATLGEQLRDQVKMQALVQEAELARLKLQIDPHFIFNSLNSINSLTITNPDKAREMIIKLSEFMRAAMAKKPEEKISLKEEMQHVMQYLTIEEVRFEDKLKLEVDIDESLESAQVPSLILQPLAENAIKYGIFGSTGKVTIRVKAMKIEKNLILSIQNNFDVDAVPQKGHGIGLKNISQRLQLIYGAQGKMEALKSPNEFKVELTIPQK